MRPHSPVQDYVPTARLTRLPAPLTEIDLSAPAISGLGFYGEIQIAVLIDTQGMVVDVTGLDNVAVPPGFLQQIAVRFKGARFRPGEIDGRAVNARITIKVVSENVDIDEQ